MLWTHFGLTCLALEIIFGQCRYVKSQNAMLRETSTFILHKALCRHNWLLVGSKYVHISQRKGYNLTYVEAITACNRLKGQNMHRQTGQKKYEINIRNIGKTFWYQIVPAWRFVRLYKSTNIVISKISGPTQVEWFLCSLMGDKRGEKCFTICCKECNSNFNLR